MKIKLNLKLLNKLTAILVVGCFFVSSVCRDAIAAAATPTMNTQEYKQIFTDFMLPYSYGKISGSHFAGTDRVVINIQDLHCHPQVQKSINDIIEMFDNKYGVSNVYLEGAYGNVSAKPFLKNLINPTQRNEILDKLLQSGRLTGAEYYSAISNKTEIIKGLEKKGPYLENLKRFGNLLEAQDQIAVILKGVEESTKKVKEQYYTRRQYKIEKLSKDYLEGKIKAEKYYRLLAKHTEKLGIDLTKYENTFLYMQLLALQSDLNYKAITTQLQTLVLLLKENLPPNAYQILLDNTKNFEETDKLYAYVIKLSKSFGLDLAINFKELDKYFNFIELSQKINPLELLKEEENLTREINTRFSDTVAQREVVFLTNFEKYLKDYLSTKITSQDYEYYKENIETYKKLWNKYVDNKVLTLLEPYMQETDKFYKINTDRNNYFTENIFNGVETEKIENIKEEPDEVSKIIENMDKVKRIDVIITGGFHSQTVSEILKQHGISYIVITPNVQDGVKEAEKTYYQIAKQQREINFQTLAARIVLDLFGDENLSQIARIKVLKDYNLSKQEVRDIIGTNVENSLLEDIFSLTDEEFIKKYNPRYDNDLQDVFDNTSVVNGLINVAEQLESDDISPANFKKLTEIIAKEYGISNEQEIEQIAQKAIKIIENGENLSILDAFTNIFKSGNQDVVLTILEVYNNYNPKTVDYFLDDKENKFEYDKEKGLYKFENDKKIYLKDYKIVDEVPMESSKESKKLEQQEISTERKFYKEMEEKIENFDFSLNRPNRNIVEENIKNLNVIIDEISISELLNDEERISLTKKLEDKVVDLIYPKDNKKEGLNILRKSTKNALIPGNVITTSMFVKDILESKLSDEVKFEIIEGVDVNDIEDNIIKDKVLEIKEKNEKRKSVLETGLEEEKAKENLQLNLQNLEAKEEYLKLEKEKEDLETELEQENLRLNLQNLKNKEEQLRLEKEKEDLEKVSKKTIDKEKQTPTLLDLVTPKFSSKGAALLVTIVTTVVTLFIPTWSLSTSKDTEKEEQEQKEQQKKNKDTATMLSQNKDLTKEDSKLTTHTVNMLRKSLNPVGALSEISIEFLGSEIINADKLFLYKHDISEAELKKAEKDGCTSIKYRIVNEAETSMGVSNIKIKQGEGKADIRVKYDGKNKEVIIYSKDGIQNLSDYEVQSLIKQAFKEGRKMKVFDKVDTLAFATGKEKSFNDIMNTMNVEIIDSSVVAPTENVYKFTSDEKFMPTTISGKMKETGLSTFEISKEHYYEYGIKEQDCKFIVRETNTNNIEQTFDNIGDNQSGVSFDFSETDIVNQESILNNIKEQKGKSKKTMNLSVYVKFGYEVYEKLSEINIFEQYGIIPIVDKNSASIVKGKKMLDIDEENKIEDIEILKNQSDILGFMFDENSVNKLGSVIGGIRTIIEYLTNDKSIYSPQEKFKDGLRKALNSRNLKKSNKYEFNCAINNLTEIRSLEELLQIDIAQEKAKDRIKEQLNSLDLSKIFTNDALICIEDLMLKDNNIEALGFIRGIVMNTIADEISQELSGKGIGDVNIKDNIEDNEIQGILIWTIQNLLEGKSIKDLYNYNENTFETGTAEEIFESIRLDLNKILAENEYKINLAKKRSTIAKSEELPTLIMSDYGKKGVAEKEFNVSANAIKSMLAAA